MDSLNDSHVRATAPVNEASSASSTVVLSDGDDGVGRALLERFLQLVNDRRAQVIALGDARSMCLPPETLSELEVEDGQHVIMLAAILHAS